MIAAVCWLPKGVAKAVPDVAQRTAEELQELLGTLEEEDLPDSVSSEDNESGNEEGMDLENEEGVNSDVAVALAAVSALAETRSRGVASATDDMAELNMDDYDKEEEDIKIFGNGGLGCAYYQNGEKDPYLNDEDEDDEEEIDDKTIRPTDLLLLTARNEEDVSHLEVWVYEEADVNMYVHHEIMLPAFPLCLAWLDFNFKSADKGNLVAIGSMQPEIEIWDLDVLDDVEPAVVLGGRVLEKKKITKKKKKTKTKTKTKLKEGSHSEAVLGLSWNHEFRNVIASGSADYTVKIWDISSQKCEHTLTHHSDKVQSVAWNPKEPTSLLSGSFDGSVALTDMRTPMSEGPKWMIPKDVECITWNPHVSHSFVVSSEDGLVHGFDVRAASTKGSNSSVFTIHAHDKATCAVSYNLVAPNLLATASMDKTVKLWDLTNDTPSCLAANSPSVGAIFTAAFCKDSPFLLAIGGSEGKLHIWNTLTEAEVARRFSQ